MRAARVRRRIPLKTPSPRRDARFTLRATYAFNRSRGESSAMLPVRDNEFNRDYYGAEVQFRPTLNGSAFKPYAAGVQVGGDGWIYKWDRYGLDRTQFDVKWTAGLSYRF